MFRSERGVGTGPSVAPAGRTRSWSDGEMVWSSSCPVVDMDRGYAVVEGVSLLLLLGRTYRTSSKLGTRHANLARNRQIRQRSEPSRRGSHWFTRRQVRCVADGIMPG